MRKILLAVILLMLALSLICASKLLVDGLTLLILLLIV